MREVVVETVGKGTRTIQVGKEKKQKKVGYSFVDIICSPRTFPHTGSDGAPTDTKCWKTTKRGFSPPRKNWQRHGERQPSRRRHRWGHVRGWIYPSVRPLNEMGLCIYPNTYE